MTKKFTILLGLLLVFSMILAACGSAGDDTGSDTDQGLPGTGATDMAGTDQALPGTGATDTFSTPLATGTSEAGMTQEPTATREATSTTMETPMATSALPGTGTTSTAMATPMATSGIPGTGTAGNYVPASNLMDANVQDSNGDQIGNVTDLFLDLCRQNVAWVAIDGDAQWVGDRQNDLLVPMSVLSWQSNSGDMTDGYFVVNVDSQRLMDAPDLDLSTLDFNMSNWDAELNTYWGGDAGMSSSANANCAINLVSAGGVLGTEAPGLLAQTEAPGMGGTQAPGSAASTPVPGLAAQTAAPGMGGTQVPGGPTVSLNGISENGMVRASDLIGMSVQDTNSDDIGEVNDVLVSVGSGLASTGSSDTSGSMTGTETSTPGSGSAQATQAPGSSSGLPGTGDASAGQVQYVVIGVGGFLGLGEKSVAIPVSALTYYADTNVLVTTRTADELSNAPTIDLNNLGTGWEAEVDAFWNNQ